jgi:hypothetical protein
LELEMSATPVPRPLYDRQPANGTVSAFRSAESAIYTHKDALSAEHFARTGHDAVAAMVDGCEVCSLIVAGTTADRR